MQYSIVTYHLFLPFSICELTLDVFITFFFKVIRDMCAFKSLYHLHLFEWCGTEPEHCSLSSHAVLRRKLEVIHKYIILKMKQGELGVGI